MGLLYKSVLRRVCGCILGCTGFLDFQLCYLWSLGLYSPHAVGAVDDRVLWNLLTRVEPTACADDAAASQDHVTAHVS